MSATTLTTESKLLGTTVMDRICNTPLVRLEGLGSGRDGLQILGKAEWANPGGSVKDRAASFIVADALKKGQISSGKGLLDATSGNTGIAYAMLGAALGFPVALCVPSNVSPERKRILSAYGAEVVWTNPADGSDGAIRKAREMIATEPERYFYADQYGNENELEGPLSHDRKRDLGADRGTRDALRRGSGNQRDVYGNDAATAGVESED